MKDPYAFSVVLPVYDGVAAAHLRRALESIYQQTLLPEEVVLVEDGPLLSSQLDVVTHFANHRPPLTRVRLPVNVGVAQALQAGLESATCPWVARMDADDVALPNRFLEQMVVMKSNDYDLVGSAMSEFEGSEGNVVGIRRLPVTHEAIAQYMRFNNPSPATKRRAASLHQG